MLTSIFHDVRYSFRALIKHRTFTLAALLTLALGIGINTSIFTLLYSVAFRPLPVKDAARVVNVYQILEGEFSREVEGNVALLSYPEYLNYRDRVAGLSGLAASADVKLYLGGNNVERINGLMVSDNYFSLLGGGSATGRTLFDNECQTTLPCPVAVLSYSFWQRRFGSDPSVVGTSITLNRQHFTVVGVAAREFRGAEMTLPDVWIPVTMQPAVMPDHKFLDVANCSWLSVVGRLKEGVSLPQVQAEMQLVAAQMDHEYPGRRTTVNVMPGSYLNFPEVRDEGTPVAILVMAAVGLVLLIACANVSNLMLARAGARRKEIAVRLAVGASRWRLIRLLLTESVLLAVMGGVVGLLLALVLPPILFTAIPEVGLDIDFKPDAVVFGYMFLISLITGIVFGLAPAIQSTKPNLTDALKSTKGAPRLARARLRSLLVIGQVAVSLVLLIAAGLLVRGLQRAQSTDLGFDQKNLLVMSLDLTTQGYDEARAATLYAQLAERLKTSPAIKSVSLVEVPPFSGARETAIEIDESSPAASSLSVGANLVSAEYFQTLGIPLRRGRLFTEDDARSGESPVVISEAMANRFWSGVDPIGKRFRDGGTSHTIIGVVDDISSRQVGRIDGPLFYMAAAPGKLGGLSFILRTNGDALASMSAVREAAGSLDKDAFVSVEPLEANVSRMLEPARMGAWFSGTVSLLALIIAATGIYGMLSYHVVERTSEIGIRMALGAQRRNVLLLIVRDGMKLAATGTAIGLAGAIALTKVMATMVFGIGPADVFTFMAVSVGALVVALLACYVPARRATRVDPLVALRTE
ncbi:MAG TPA: ABC transporter permease [Pyrinomonadaceae bacterium]|jgi:predicted permease|nr:ABC transporter permease [Pyrinomonadaceae bacterium]